jgi:hypothetical protein
MHSTRLMFSRRLLLVGMVSCLFSVSEAAEQSVKPLGVFPFVLPGLAASRDAQPKAFLWCQGATLLGVVVPETKNVDCNVAGQKRAAPRALLLRDGRCETGGTAVSFGLLVSRKAWVFDSAARTPTPQERTAWLLLRFEGSVKTGELTGAVVQVDVSHPGLPFQRTSVEAAALASESQASFADETTWRNGIAQTSCLAAGEP